MDGAAPTEAKFSLSLLGEVVYSWYVTVEMMCPKMSSETSQKTRSTKHVVTTSNSKPINTKFSLQRHILLQVQWRSYWFPGQREWWFLWNSHLGSSACHIVNHLTHLTMQPTVTSVPRIESADPESLRDTPKRMHVVNRKQNCKTTKGCVDRY